jgi:hypothetical protein
MPTEAELRRQWYQEIPTENTKLKHRIWKRLESRGMVDMALLEPDTALQELLNDAEPYLEGVEMGAQFSAPPLNTGKQEDQDEIEEIRSVLNDLEREQAAAFEEHVARIAANDFRVRRFRDKVLGELLTPEQALTLIYSPAAWSFSRFQFERCGIPLTNHTAELKETEEYRVDGRVGNNFTIRVEPPGIERTINRLLRKLPFVDESGHAESIKVGEGSVLGDLAELADRLYATYPLGAKGGYRPFRANRRNPSDTARKDVLQSEGEAEPGTESWWFPLWNHYPRDCPVDISEDRRSCLPRCEKAGIPQPQVPKVKGEEPQDDPLRRRVRQAPKGPSAPRSMERSGVGRKRPDLVLRP